MLLGWLVRATEGVLAQLKDEALKVGLEVNVNKTKHMRIICNLSNFRQDLNV